MKTDTVYQRFFYNFLAITLCVISWILEFAHLTLSFFNALLTINLGD